MKTLRYTLAVALVAISLSACTDTPATFITGAIVGGIMVHNATK